MVDGGNILDLVIEAESRPSIPSNDKDKSVVDVDPAIVSYNRPPRKDDSGSQSLPNGERLGGPFTTNQSVPLHIAPDSLAQSPSPSPAIKSLKPLVSIKTPKEDLLPSSIASENVTSATLTGPFSELSLDGVDQSDIFQRHSAKEIAVDHKNLIPDPGQSVLLQTPAKNIGKRARRGAAKGRTAEDGGSAQGRSRFSQQETLVSVASQSPNTPRRPRGGRESPLIENLSQSNRRPIASADDSFPRLEAAQPKKKARRHRPQISEDQNGWATEEVTDIQDMGDFDFEANLSKFDKHGVFNKIREADATAEADRLVSFNRIPGKIGTVVRNLHHTENVLSPNANGHLAWNSGDSEKDINETRVSSVRSLSRASLRKPPSRKGSSLYDTENLASSGVLPDPKMRNIHLSHDQAGSPKTHNTISPYYSRANSRSRAALRITPSNHICPCVNPLQMVELEQLSISELGLTEDIITENASRGIAETARKVVVTERGKSTLALPGGSPLVVILVGNTKSGSRAVAAGRQLRNHGYRVVICVLGLEREADLLDSVRRQLNIYRKCGGHVTKAEGLEKSLQQMQAPIELILDALLGMHLLFDDLRTEDQTVYCQLASWANASEVGVLAVDIPSGLDASSGIYCIFFQKNETAMLTLR